MAITLERLPPERTAVAPVAAAAGGCCSCCCCCFHSMGSLIGAAMARPPKVTETDAPVATIAGTPTTPKYSANREYWMSFLIASLVFLIGTTAYFSNEKDLMLGVAVFYALAVPAIQLAASIIAWIMILVSKSPGRGERLNHLGRITAYSLLGALLGGIVVWAIFQR